MISVKLQLLCKDGNLEEIKKYILPASKIYYKSVRRCFGNNGADMLISYASIYGRLKIVKYLAEECNVEISYRCWTGAVINGHLEIIKYFAQKFNVKYEPTDVQLAVSNNRFEMVKYLVENHSFNNTLKGSVSCICLASTKGHFKIVKYLIEKRGTDLHDMNQSVRSAMIEGHFEVVKFLLERGAICPLILDNFFRYTKYLTISEKGESKRKERGSKKIYFWWVQKCYDLNNVSGHRMMYKKYQEYKKIK